MCSWQTITNLLKHKETSCEVDQVTADKASQMAFSLCFNTKLYLKARQDVTQQIDVQFSRKAILKQGQQQSKSPKIKSESVDSRQPPKN